MINPHPCSKCRNYYAIRVGSNKQAAHGWCSVKSIYPHQEEPGQLFPDDVKRAAPEERAKPYIVRGNSIEARCDQFRTR